MSYAGGHEMSLALRLDHALVSLLLLASCGGGDARSSSPGLELRPLKLLERLSPGAGVSVGKQGLAGQRRIVAHGVAPFEFSTTIRVPDGRRLWFGLARDGGGASSIPVSIQAHAEGDSRTLFEHDLDPGTPGWQEFDVDLSALGEQEVTLEFVTGSSGSGPEPARVLWSTLYVGPDRRERPDVFLFLIDTLVPGHLSAYGYERETSPNIDALAAEGVLFENAFSVAPWTDPSVLSLFTGVYPSDVWEPARHADTIKKKLPSSLKTLASVLSENGYHTIAATDHPGIRSQRFGEGFDTYCHLYAGLGAYDEWEAPGGRKPTAELEPEVAGVLRQTPASTVREIVRGLTENRPPGGTFLYVHLIYPHRPYDPPQRFKTMFGPPASAMQREDRDGMINLYDAEIRRTDGLIGELLAELGCREPGDDSIVVVLADHGEGFWEHDLDDHGNSLYNELLRIPLILRAPNRLPSGRTTDAVASIVDVFPTLLDLLGIETPHAGRGMSLRAAAEGKADPDRLVLSEFPHSLMIDGRTLQSRDEKLIRRGHDSEEVEYFRVIDDPGERRDLSGDEGAHPRVQRLLGALSSLGSPSEVAPPELFEPPDEMLDALEAMGYVE